MNLQMIIEHLNAYNEEELFYKAYHHAKKEEESFSLFLEQLDMEEIIRHKRIVPELFPEIIPYYMGDGEYFDLLSTKSVFLSKHNRYTPLFMHQHDFFEMIYVISGCCRHYVYTEQQILKAGDLCLLAPSVTHGIFVDDDSIIINILIRRSTIEDIFFNVLRDKSIISSFFLNNMYARKREAYLIFHTLDDADILTELLEMYQEQFQEDEYSNRIIESMVTIFLNNLIRKYRKTVEYPSNSIMQNPKGLYIISYMLDHYATITLKNLAEHLNYSIPYCSFYIKNTTGYTFSQLLRNIKFNRAEMLLKTTSLSINKISTILGYENPENFMRAFKQVYGVTPSQFREK